MCCWSPIIEKPCETDPDQVDGMIVTPHGDGDENAPLLR